MRKPWCFKLVRTTFTSFRLAFLIFSSIAKHLKQYSCWRASFNNNINSNNKTIKNRSLRFKEKFISEQDSNFQFCLKKDYRNYTYPLCSAWSMSRVLSFLCSWVAKIYLQLGRPGKISCLSYFFKLLKDARVCN